MELAVCRVDVAKILSGQCLHVVRRQWHDVVIFKRGSNETCQLCQRYLFWKCSSTIIILNLPCITKLWGFD